MTNVNDDKPQDHAVKGVKPEEKGSGAWKLLAPPVVVGCLVAGSIAHAQWGITEQPQTPPAQQTVPQAPAVPGTQLYQNPAEGFEIRIPEGWTIQPNPNPADVVKVEFYTNDQAFVGSNCNVAIVRNPLWAGLTQEQINQNVQQGQLANEIVLEMEQAGQNGAIISQGTSMVGPVAVQNGEYGMDVQLQDGTALRVYVTKYIAPVPGAFYNVNCSTRASWTAALAGPFNTVLGSLKITR